MTTPKVVTMYDTIGATAKNIPAVAPKVAGYVTGSYEWTAADWARFPHAGKVRIDQSAHLELYAEGKADVADIERGAGTPEAFATAAASRHGRGMGNCVYASRTNLELTAQALEHARQDAGWWAGRIDGWLTDPSLSLSAADALVGTVLYGFTLRAVQWAWPTTNPHTEVQGGTLAALNLDLSVAQAAWFPAKAAS